MRGLQPDLRSCPASPSSAAGPDALTLLIAIGVALFVGYSLAWLCGKRERRVASEHARLKDLLNDVEKRAASERVRHEQLLDQMASERVRHEQLLDQMEARMDARSLGPKAAPTDGGRFACVVFGAINMDTKATTDTKWPQVNYNGFGRIETSPGGKGANEAVALARLGVRTSLLGGVGNDVYGAKLVEQLAEEGVDVERIRKHERTQTGSALQIVTSKDKRHMTVTAVAAANDALQREDVERADRFLKAQAQRYKVVVLLVQLELKPELSLQLVERALQHRCAIVLKAGCAPRVRAGG